MRVGWVLKKQFKFFCPKCAPVTHMWQIVQTPPPTRSRHTRRLASHGLDVNIDQYQETSTAAKPRHSPPKKRLSLTPKQLKYFFLIHFHPF